MGSRIRAYSIPTSLYGWFLVDYADRLYPWGDYCGIPGGIPNRTTIYTTLGLAGQAPAYVQSVTVAQLNTALDNCPSEQTVRLYPGTYNFTGEIDFSGLVNKTLRGYGPGQTIVNGPSGSHVIGMANTTQVLATRYNVSGTIAKGAMSLTLAVAPPAQATVGNLMIIDELSDYDLMWHREEGTGYPHNGTTRGYSFTTRITNVTGNVISFAAPIPYAFASGLSPQVRFMQYGVSTSRCGVESMTINANAGGTDKVAQIIYADRFWMKDVDANEFTGGNGIVQVQASAQCEFRRCYVHDCDGYPNQGDGYAFYFWYDCSNALAEDNVIARTAMSIIASGTSGNVWGYNYSYASARAGMTYGCGAVLCNHGPHGVMSLFEGNIFDAFGNDGYHGSTSHQTLFRNCINGINPVTANDRVLIDLARASYYHTVVGNVLGDPSWTPDAYEMHGGQSHSYTSVYKLEYPDTGSTSYTPAVPWTNWTASFPNTLVRDNLYLNGNYDYYNAASVWVGGVTRSIPASLRHSSKPSWFGSLPWPAIGPDVSGYVQHIPAKDRWDAYVISADIDDLFAETP